MASSKFRISRYNWLGQKLLAQQQYGEIVRLSEHMSSLVGTEPIAKPISDHLSYLHCLALVKTSCRLDEVIFALQRLNYDKNNQYFLLLCQCLLYLGNYDSVVALCKQVINKEIDSIAANQEASPSSRELITFDSVDWEGGKVGEQAVEADKKDGKLKDWLAQESFEFKRVFANINRNKLINEPKLWFIFGLCLEYQLQFKDAFFAFKVASKLAAGDESKFLIQQQQSVDIIEGGNLATAASISNFYGPHTKYAEFCIQYKADYKAAELILSQACEMFPKNYTISPFLALTISSQPTASRSKFHKAVKLITTLENYSNSYRNPSIGYNNLALWCKRKLGQESLATTSFLGCDTAELSKFGDQNRLNLNFLLIKSYLIFNGILLESERNQARPTDESGSESMFAGHSNVLLNQSDRLIETLRQSDASCWSSASLWNNLGLCYLMKRKFIACLSCLLKAHSINSLDWRINYNLALACIHVGLIPRAFTCLLAASNLYNSKFDGLSSPTLEARRIKRSRRAEPLIQTLMAICYDKLGEIGGARRTYIEIIRECAIGRDPNSSGTMPISSLVNYLIHLHLHPDQSDEQQQVRLKLRLLDQLEQNWLQRSQNDSQFSQNLLELARQVGEETFSMMNPSMRKTYAWTKGEPNTLSEQNE